ncbi:Hypothetical protein D9617_3g019230 [Elsinoe fawcettii]|nr:Hypothetical protein D9617_3g019230 [Elsinoe fawcettii]
MNLQEIQRGFKRSSLFLKRLQSPYDGNVLSLCLREKQQNKRVEQLETKYEERKKQKQENDDKSKKERRMSECRTFVLLSMFGGLNHTQAFFDEAFVHSRLADRYAQSSHRGRHRQCY